MKLEIELIPKTSFFKNVRALVSKEEWNFIKNQVYKRADFKCEICKAKGQSQGFSHSVECHEIWTYNEETLIQNLEGLIALCPLCHKVKHSGLTMKTDGIDLILDHLKLINQMNEKDAYSFLIDAFALWKHRNNFQWKLNTNYINKYLKQ